MPEKLTLNFCVLILLIELHSNFLCDSKKSFSHISEGMYLRCVFISKRIEIRLLLTSTYIVHCKRMCLSNSWNVTLHCVCFYVQMNFLWVML
jgi:hypothetical protein